jgi:D-alanyl-D-alanine carboxypeptidase
VELPARRAYGRDTRRILLIVGLLASLASALATAPAGAARPGGGKDDAARLQMWLDRYVAAGVPGAVALERDGKRVIRVASGVRRLGRPGRVRAGDRFRVGSVNKTFTAVLVLQLAERHRLALDDSVERWLPGLVPNGQAITIRQLLSHTSGLFDYSRDVEATFGPFLAGDRDHIWTPRDLVAIAVAHPPDFPPGAAWQYSNTGYILLGLIIEAATQRSYESVLRSRILRPLGLRRTTLDTHGAIAGRYAHGYSRLLSPTGQLEDVSDLSPSWGWAAGALVSTADDVVTFYDALLTGHLLRRHELTEMQTTVSMGLPGENYGLGLWETRTVLISPTPLSCGPAWGHNGDIFGYHADAFVRADGRHAIVLLGTLANDEYDAAIEAAQFGVLETGLCR